MKSAQGPAQKRISFMDVLSLTPFKSLTQFDLLRREMDWQVAPYLFKMGIDVDKPLLVQACKHRTLDKQEVLGYSYMGTERQDSEWLKTRFSSLDARISAQPDKDLAGDMIRMSREGMDFSRFKQMALDAATSAELALVRERREELPPLDTYEQDLSEISVLQKIMKEVRGELHPDEDMVNPPKGIL